MVAAHRQSSAPGTWPLLRRLTATAAVLAAATLATPAAAQPLSVSGPASSFDACEAAIASAGAGAVRPPGNLLLAIARVESGRVDPGTRRVRPWPWTINVDGAGSYFETKAEAIAAVRALQQQGKRSIDVGCMQVNLMHHPAAFQALDDAFDPAINANYANSFLSDLFRRTGNWNLATAMYHSQDPERGEDYQRRVFGQVMTAMGVPAGAAARARGAAWPPVTAVYASLPPLSLSYRAFAPATTGPAARPTPGTQLTSAGANLSRVSGQWIVKPTAQARSAQNRPTLPLSRLNG